MADYFEDNKRTLLTRFHILETLRVDGPQRQDELSKRLGKHPRKIYHNLKKLINYGWVDRKKMKHKNHDAFFYSVSEVAEKWRVKNRMMTYLDKSNPCLPRILRVQRQYSTDKRDMVGGKARIIPAKELSGFR